MTDRQGAHIMRRAPLAQQQPAHHILLARTNAPNTLPSIKHNQLHGQGQENIVPSSQSALFKQQQQQQQQHHDLLLGGRTEPLDLLKGRMPSKTPNAFVPPQKHGFPAAPVPLQAKVPLGVPAAATAAANPSTKAALSVVDKSTRSVPAATKTRTSKSKAPNPEWIAQMRATLKSSRFFLDSVDNTTSSKLARSITSSGGEIAMFLSLSDITHIITTKAIPTADDVHQFQEQQKKQQEQQQQQPSQQQQHGFVPTLQPMALPQPPQGGILLKALSRKIAVWSVADAIQILSAITGETSAAQNEPSLRELLLRDRTFGPTTAQNDDYHVFKGVYLLVEDTTGYYQTIIGHEFEPQSTDHPWIRLHYQKTSVSPFIWIPEKSKIKQEGEQQQVVAPEGRVVPPAVAPPTATATPAPAATEKAAGQQEGQLHTPEPIIQDRPLPPPRRKMINGSAPASGIINSMATQSASTQSVIGRTTNPLDPSPNLKDPRLEQIGKRVLTTVPVDRVLPPGQRPNPPQPTTATPPPVKPTNDAAAVVPTQRRTPLTRSSARIAGSAVPEHNTKLNQTPPAPSVQPSNVRGSASQATVGATLTPAGNKASRVKNDGDQVSAKQRNDTAARKRQEAELPPLTDIGFEEKDLPKAKSGYCENCKAHYTNVREHAATSRHRRYAFDKRKFQSLDQLLAKLPRRRRDQSSSREGAPVPPLNEKPSQTTSTEVVDNKPDSGPDTTVVLSEVASSTTAVGKESSSTVVSSVTASQEKCTGISNENEQDHTVAPINQEKGERLSPVKDSDNNKPKFEKLIVENSAEEDEATTEPLPPSYVDEQKDTVGQAAIEVAIPESTISPVEDDLGGLPEQEEAAQGEEDDGEVPVQGESSGKLDEARDLESTSNTQHIPPPIARFFEQEPPSVSLSSRLETDITVPDEKFLDSAANVPQSMSTDLGAPATATPIRLVMGTSSAIGQSEAGGDATNNTQLKASALVAAGGMKDFDEGLPGSPDGGTNAEYSDDGEKGSDEPVAMVKSPSAGRGMYSRLGGLPSRPRNQPQLLSMSVPASGYHSSGSRLSDSMPLRTPLKSSALNFVEPYQHESRPSTPIAASTTPPTAFPPSGAFHGPLKRKLENIMADERASENGRALESELRFQGLVQAEGSSPSAANTSARGPKVLSGRWLASKSPAAHSPFSRKSTTTTFPIPIRGLDRAAAGNVPPSPSGRRAEFLARNRDVDMYEDKENQMPSGRRTGPPVVMPASLKATPPASQPWQHHPSQEAPPSSQPTTPVKQTRRYYDLDDNIEPPPAPKLPMFGFWPEFNQQQHPESYLSHHYGAGGRLAPTSPTSPASPSQYPPSEGSGGQYGEYDSRLMSSPTSGSPSQRASKRVRQFPVMSHAEQQEERCFHHYQGNKLPEPAGQKKLRNNSSSFVEEFSEYGEGCMVFIE